MPTTTQRISRYREESQRLTLRQYRRDYAYPVPDVAILAAGPSLNIFLQDPVCHDAYIGANWSATAFNCDFWLYRDSSVPDLMTPLGHPIILTFAWRSTYRPIPKGFQYLFCEELEKEEDYQVPLCSASLYTIHAVHCLLRPEKITLYGFDFDGDQYFNGRTQGIGVPAVRWPKEKERFLKILKAVRDRGTEVIWMKEKRESWYDLGT